MSERSQLECIALEVEIEYDLCRLGGSTIKV
jgi:hypothetical protein